MDQIEIVIPESSRRQAWDDWLKYFPPFGGQAFKQLGGVSVAVTGIAPERPITIDDHPALPGIGARRSAMRHGIYEQECIPSIQVDFDGAFYAVYFLGLIPTCFYTWMNEVCLVTAWDDHRAAITRTDIG